MTDDAKGLSEVQRYTMFSNNDSRWMEPSSTGHWVPYPDYAALAERLKAMTEREQSLMNQVREFNEAIKKAGLTAQYLGGELFILNEPLVKAEERLKSCEEERDKYQRQAKEMERIHVESLEKHKDFIGKAIIERDRLTADNQRLRGAIERVADWLDRRPYLKTVSDWLRSALTEPLTRGGYDAESQQ